MKKSWSFIALLAAMAAGTASAAGTTAGTTITNQAEIIYTPEGSTTPAPPVPSNTVTTTVLPKPSFSITPNDGSTDPNSPNYQQPGQTATAKPCDEVVFPYTLTNTGNVPNETYTLTNTPDPTGAVKTPTDIKYYIDANANGVLEPAERTTAVTSIGPVAVDGVVKFFQVYTIPCTATSADKYGADPSGTRNPNPTPGYEPTTPGYVQPVDKNNSNTTAVNRQDGVVIGPSKDPMGASDATVTPPYTSPEGLTITPNNNDEQVAQATTTTTSVTFTNTVKNTGNRTDVFDITTNNNFPAGTTVTLLKPDGTPLTDTDGDGIPDVGPLAPGATADILVKVTFPAGTQPTPGTTPTVTVTATSSNDPTKSDPTKDIVNLPGLSFGDPTATPGGDPTLPGAPLPGQPGNPTTPIVIDPATCTTPTKASVPMEVANLGSFSDTYDVSGTATITLNSGATVTAPVVYYFDNNSDGIFNAGDTPLVDTNANGIADTGAIAPGTEKKLVAVVDVPCDAAKQTITLNQKASSPASGTVTDTNDTITVGAGGKPTAVKTGDKTTALPGENITYTVVGTNKTNANITKAMVCDTVPANTAFVSFTATSTPSYPILYSNDGGVTWAATATAPAAGQKLCAAVNTNGDNTITTADILKPGESINVTFTVKVN